MPTWPTFPTSQPPSLIVRAMSCAENLKLRPYLLSSIRRRTSSRQSRLSRSLRPRKKLSLGLRSCWLDTGGSPALVTVSGTCPVTHPQCVDEGRERDQQTP